MEEALEVLRRLGNVVQEGSERELCYRVETPIFAIAVYPKSGTVGSFGTTIRQEGTQRRVGRRKLKHISVGMGH